MNIFSALGKFECDWTWYIQSQGYFVRQALPLTSDGDVEDASDIDIWGIRYLPPIVPSVAIVDCKDARKPRTYERILWTKGLGEYDNADQLYVAAPKPSWKAIDFGRRAGVHVVPYALVRNHLGNLQPNLHAYGQARHDLYGTFFASRAKVLKADSQIGESLFRARQMYRFGLSITNLNRAIDGLRQSSESLSGTVPESDRAVLWFYTCCEYIAAFALNLLKVAEETFSLSDHDRQNLLVMRLTYGDLRPDKAREIAQLSYDLGVERTRRALPIELQSRITVETPSILEPPPYATSIVGLLERVLANPMLYWHSVRLLDAMLFDALVPKRVPTVADIPYIAESMPVDDVVKAAKNYISVVCNAAGVSRGPFWFEIRDDQSVGAKVNANQSGTIANQRTPEMPLDSDPSAKQELK
jgi:hypothetical protein